MKIILKYKNNDSTFIVTNKRDHYYYLQQSNIEQVGYELSETENKRQYKLAWNLK